MEAQYINVSELFRKLRTNWHIVLITIGVVGLLGLIIILTTPRRYQSVVQLAPEHVEEDNYGSREAIYPEIYPNIVSSNTFVWNLFPLMVTKADGSLSVDYRTYMVRYQKKSLLDYPKSWAIWIMRKLRGEDIIFSGDVRQGAIRLNREDEDVIRGIKGVIQCIWDKKTDVITISVVDQDPLVAAIVVDSVTARLQAAITDYRTAKGRLDLEFAQNICDEAYADYQQANAEYTSYAETYQYATSEGYKLQIEALRQSMELRFQSYRLAHEQLQEAKSKLQEQTPAFTIIQESMVAGKPYGTSRAVKLILWLMLGCVIGIVIAYRK